MNYGETFKGGHTCTLQQLHIGHGSSIGCAFAWYADGRGFNPHVRQNILSLTFVHAKILTTILSFPLIQEYIEHPAGVVTRVSVMSRKVIVKIRDAENRCWWCRDKNRWKRANIPFRLVLSGVPFKFGVWNYSYKMPKYVLSLLVKPKLKHLLSVLRYRLPRFRIKGQINV